MTATQQLLLIHLSDVHFGRNHRFMPAATAAGDIPDEPYPSLFEKLREDLVDDDPGCPVVVAVTGDLAEVGSYDEFKRAEVFVRELADAEFYGRKQTPNCVFLVPGNHDVLFDSGDVGQRWQQWTEFYNRSLGTSIGRDDPNGFAQVHDRLDDLGAIIVTLNSAVHVARGTPDEIRGRVDLKQLEAIEHALEKIPAKRMTSAIRVALIHHHPVLIPALAEAHRGYDAVHNSARLLTLLRRFGFHLVLHGHKHDPYVFTDDTSSAFVDRDERPILVIAGGSAGSTALPAKARPLNCYNQIVIKWHPDAGQTRIRVVTRGLCTSDDDGTDWLPYRWRWKTLKVDDRDFVPRTTRAVPIRAAIRLFDQRQDGTCDKRRTDEYARLRGNIPVVEVRPSLVPGQAYEARFWLAQHPALPGQGERPARVTWSAGKKFPVLEVKREDDPELSGRFNYWASMLVQARLEFDDGTVELAHFYARLPGKGPSEAEEANA
jgi:3',5'-cyclic AMP phosphodiesterase CpdA